MKTPLSALAFAAVSGLTAFAGDPFQWVDSDQDPVVLNHYGQVLSDRFDLRVSDSDSYKEIVGFEPGIDFLTSATVGFKFLGLPGAVDWTAGTNWRIFETSDPFVRTISVLGVPVLFTLTGPMDKTGYLDYSLVYLGEGTTSLTMNKAWVSANGEDNTYIPPVHELSVAAGVPDTGSTALLLATSLLGIGFFGRRKTAA
jgi:hypothetical protein